MRRPRHAAEGADKSAQGILEVFWHGRYATFLKDTIVCLRLICAAVGSPCDRNDTISPGCFVERTGTSARNP